MAKDSFKPLETVVDEELIAIAEMEKQFEKQIHEITVTSTEGIFFDKVGEGELGTLTEDVLSQIKRMADSSQEELRKLLRKATKSKDGKEMNHLYRKANHRPLFSFNRDKDKEKRVTSQMLYDKAIANAQNELNQQVGRVASQTEIELNDATESFKTAVSSICTTTVARTKEKETLLETYKRKPVVYIFRGSYKEDFSVTQLLGAKEIEEFISANREKLLYEDSVTWGFCSFPELLECWRTMNEEAYNSGYNDGEDDGYSRGYADGEATGYDRGYSDGSD